MSEIVFETATGTATRAALDAFFVTVQFKAWRQAELATGNRDDALDIVQEAMLKLAQKYSAQAENWPQLFQRILQNAIRDWYRRKKVRSMLFWFQREQHEEEEGEDLVPEQGQTPEKENPLQQLQHAQLSTKVYAAISKLPLRQQQAFVLRAWWEYDTRDSAFAMNCTEGSVKTHYARALARLRELLAAEDC